MCFCSHFILLSFSLLFLFVRLILMTLSLVLFLGLVFFKQIFLNRETEREIERPLLEMKGETRKLAQEKKMEELKNGTEKKKISSPKIRSNLSYWKNSKTKSQKKKIIKFFDLWIPSAQLSTVSIQHLSPLLSLLQYQQTWEWNAIASTVIEKNFIRNLISSRVETQIKQCQKERLKTSFIPPLSVWIFFVSKLSSSNVLSSGYDIKKFENMIREYDSQSSGSNSLPIGFFP